ncbi:MAG: NUDIX domain-containing protein [Desulfobulbaceae bacterium]|nr:NUDIX domain-containing protein [Desulfobulbaceae bacterium]
MNKNRRKYCHVCGLRVIRKKEDGILRDYCKECHLLFYDNPLPVVSIILVSERRVLLVKRGRKPYRGKWCLPTGFAESGESIADAALRELKEETGVIGRIVQLIDVNSSSNYFYGDLLFLTYEVESVGGIPRPADDAVAVKYFSLEKIPVLAFDSNIKALNHYIKNKKEYWDIVDSFRSAVGDCMDDTMQVLLSDTLVELIEQHSMQIASLWLEDVTTNATTPTYHRFSSVLLFERFERVLSHFRDWLAGSYGGQNIQTYYTHLGRERRLEGFRLSEVVSALNLIKKHIWEFALSRDIWHRTIDIYKMLELERRIALFFDKAVYYTATGYEE